MRARRMELVSTKKSSDIRAVGGRLTIRDL